MNISYSLLPPLERLLAMNAKPDLKARDATQLQVSIAVGQLTLALFPDHNRFTTPIGERCIHLLVASTSLFFAEACVYLSNDSLAETRDAITDGVMEGVMEGLLFTALRTRTITQIICRILS